MPSPIRPHLGPTPTATTTASSSVTTNGAACFASSSLVTLASGAKVPMRHLRRGMRVQTPLGPRRVAALLMTVVTDLPVCDLRNVLVTAWHPVSQEAASWHFPRMVARGHGRYTGRMCSVLLEKDTDPRAHAIWVSPAAPGYVHPAVRPAPATARHSADTSPAHSAPDSNPNSNSTPTPTPTTPSYHMGFWGVTLGHGLRKPSRYDVRGHPFFGDYAAVVRNLVSLGVDEGGIVMSGGIVKDRATGLVTGFAPIRRRTTGRSDRTVTIYIKVPNPLSRNLRLAKEAKRRARRL